MRQDTLANCYLACGHMLTMQEAELSAAFLLIELVMHVIAFLLLGGLTNPTSCHPFRRCTTCTVLEA